MDHTYLVGTSELVDRGAGDLWLVFRSLGLGEDDGALEEKHSSFVLVVSLVHDQVSLSQDLALFAQVPLEPLQALHRQHVVAVAQYEVDHLVCFLEGEE